MPRRVRCCSRAGVRAAISDGGKKLRDGTQALHNRASQFIPGFPGGKCELDAKGHQAGDGCLSKHPQRVLHLEVGRNRLIPQRKRDDDDDAEARRGHVIGHRTEGKEDHEERRDDPQQPKRRIAQGEDGADQDERGGSRKDRDDR